jgi:cobalt-zinc-cadmium efflux system outer membrane protein
MKVPCYLWLLCLPLYPGCCFFTAREVDRDVQDLALRIGVEPMQGVRLLPSAPSVQHAASPTDRVAAETTLTEAEAIQLVNFAEWAQAPGAPQVTADETKPMQRPLPIPPNLPGGEAPPINLPDNPAERHRYVMQMFPPIEALPPLPKPAPSPLDHPLTLADLQRLGEEYSPTIKNAYAAVEAARGAAYQAGQYPNPTLGYEHDTVETGGAGYPGFFLDQLIKTGGKLTVAQAAATMEIFTAQLALRRAKSDLRYAIRGSYFAVLVAQENVRVSEALFRFTEEIYRIQVDILDKGFGAGYEPMQLRPLVRQAQIAVLQAHNQYRASWQQLAASLGLPNMPPTELEGRVDRAMPAFEYQAVLDALQNHTDVLTAQVAIKKAEYNLKLARLQPLPDVDVRMLVQKDYTTPPNQLAHSAILSMPIPIWDQNKGGIRQAEWLLAQASVGPEQSRNALIGTLADAWNRYLTARRTVEWSALQIRDQVRVYRGLYARRQSKPEDVGFGDLVTAEQTLAAYIAAYITALGAQWQAVVDLANLMQTEDLFQTTPQQQGIEPVPDIRCLLPPPAPGAAGQPADHGPKKEER